MKAIYRGGLFVLAVLTLGACDPRKADSIPLEEALVRPPANLMPEKIVNQPQLPAGVSEATVDVAGRQWIVTPTEFELPETMVAPVVPAQGVVFHSLAWDREPFDRLLVEDRPGVWREFVEVW